MVTDPIADTLSALKNASLAGKEEVVVPFSSFKERLISLLKREGFVGKVRKFKEKKGARLFLAVELLYGKSGSPKLTHVKRISKPGQRIYVNADRLKSPPAGVRIVSTSCGLLTSREARKRRLGGELVAEVW